MAQVHSAAHPSPLKPARQSPPRSRAPRRGPRQLPAPLLYSRVANLPSGKRADSTSLEGNEPTPGKADQLRLARGHPSTERTNVHPLNRPLYIGIKCRQLRCSTRVRRRQAATPHSNSTRSPVRQLRSLLHHPRHCSDTVGTCDALCGCARRCSLHCAAYSLYFLCCRTLERHGHDPRKRLRP